MTMGLVDRAPGGLAGMFAARAERMERIVPPVSALLELDVPSGPKARAVANMAAIRVLRTVASPGDVTPEDRAALARWSSWGAVPAIFDERDEAWADERAELRSLLSEDEWSAARRTTINAHYTPPEVVDAMWAAVGRLGFRGGRVLEPGCGAGNFLRAAPAGCDLLGVELDPITAGIARLLHPGATIWTGGFEHFQVADGWFDLAIGNVPFGPVALHDPVHNPNRRSMHNHFIYKSLRLTRPGGLVALVTSRFTMDAKTNAHRGDLIGVADLVGAVRLPSGSMRRVAGTDVIVDVLVLRRRGDGEPAGGADWLEVVSVDTADGPVDINGYFAERPEMVLGTLGAHSGQYNATDMTVEAFDRELDEQLAEAFASFCPAPVMPAAPVDAPVQVAAPVAEAGPIVGPVAEADPAVWLSEVLADVPDQPEPKKRRTRVKVMEPRPAYEAGDYDPALHQEGTILRTTDLGFVRVMGGMIEGFEPTSQKDVPELTALLDLRDTVLALLAEQGRSSDDDAFEPLRVELNERYDAYVAKWGPLGRFSLAKSGKPDPETGEEKLRRIRPRMGGFGVDPAFHTVMALEHFDPDDQTATKADIFRRRVVGPRVVSDHAEEPGEALAMCLDVVGRVDLEVIAGLLGCDAGDAMDRLGDLVYLDPVAGLPETSAQYLSGNVRRKLRAAQRAAEHDDRFARNVEALRAVHPVDLGPNEIDARLGAPFIEPDDIRQFILDTFMDAQRAKWAPVQVEHVAVNASWEVDIDSWQRSTIEMTSQWGTNRADAIRLLMSSLNQQPHTVYDTIDLPGGGSRRVVNKEATFVAREKQAAIEDRFRAWVWEDEERAERLCRVYNETFNSMVLPTFDGSYLTLPGMTLAITPNPHQRDAVARILQSPTALLAHPVGAGKAQPMDAPVLTPTGFRRMGDLMVGDEVVAHDGSVTTITGVFPQGPRDVYRVEFSDGAAAECDIEHLWEVTTPDDRIGRGRAEPRVLTLGQLLEKGLTSKRGARRYAVPIGAAAEFDGGHTRPLDPYLIGLILGDGSVTQRWVTFTSADPEMVAAFDAALPVGYNLTARPSRSSYEYRVTSEIPHSRYSNHMIEWLYDLGLMGMDAFHKHIPDAYREAPVAVRLAVLQGLLDTDGTLDARHGNGVSLTSASKQLIDDAAWLARSLGGVAHVGVRKDKDTEYHRVTIALPPGMAPFRLARKASIYVGRSKYPLLRSIVSATRIGVKPMQCISVAHPRQLYVTNDFVVTHNTLCMAAAGMEMRRLGMVNKPAYAVPNHMLDQFATEFLQLYPQARLMVPTKADMTAGGRKGFVARCAMGDWDAVILTHSAFERIPISKETAERFVRAELSEYRAAIDMAEQRMSVKRLEQSVARLEQKLLRMLDAPRDDGVNFEATGIDYIFFDESQVAKNLPFPSRSRTAASTGSQRATDLHLKLSYLRQRLEEVSHARRGHRVATFATATPIANTVAEMFVVQKYLQPDVLADAGIGQFDAWAATFGETVTTLELAPDGGSYRMNSRFAKFHNVPELTTMFRAVADVLDPEDLHLPVPDVAGGKPETVIVPASDTLREYVEELVERAKNIRTGGVDPKEDNMLKVCGDGRKAALDLRLVTLPPDPNGGKLGACADRVGRIFHDNRDRQYRLGDEMAPRPGAFQIVFSDIGTPRDTWNVYDELRGLLVARGVPANMVRFVHEAADARAKAELFAACRAGRVAVLVGSTGKMGIGTNVQTRLLALHHLDCPWRPDEIEQREGRAIRQGNQNDEVAVFRYATEASFDVYMWQTVERKARFISQIIRGATAGRDIEDIDEVTLSYAEVKALATGNPLIMEKAGVDNDVARLARLRQAHEVDQRNLARRHAESLDRIDLTQRWIDMYEKAIPQRDLRTGDDFTAVIDGETFDRPGLAGDALVAAIDGVWDRAVGTSVTVGRLAGFDIEVSQRRHEFRFEREVHLRLTGSGVWRVWTKQSERVDGLGLIQSVLHELAKMEDDLRSKRGVLELAYADRDKAADRLGLPFDQEQVLVGLLRRQAELAEQLGELEERDDDEEAA